MTSIREWKEDLEGDPALQKWIAYLKGKQPSTRSHYMRSFRQFLTRWGLKPFELYTMRLEEAQSNDPLETGLVRSRLVQFMREFKDNDREEWPPELEELVKPGKKAAVTSRQIGKAVVSFFNQFGERMELRVKPQDKPKGSYNGPSGITIKHLGLTWDHAGEEYPYRNRAVLAVLKDGGLRSGDLGFMKVGQYREAQARATITDTGEKFIAFNMETEKENIYASVHLGPEAIDAVDLYLERVRPGALDVEPIFTMRQPKNKKGESRARDGFMAISGNAVGSTIKRMIGRGLGPEAKGRSAHSIRKRHRTSLQGGGVNDKWIDLMQGKAVGVYTKPEPEDLMKAYVKAYDELRIKPAESSGIKDLRERVKSLEQDVYLAEHGLDYRTDQLIAHGIKLSEDDPLHDFDVFTRRMGRMFIDAIRLYEKDPEAATEMLKRASKEVRSVASPEAEPT